MKFNKIYGVLQEFVIHNNALYVYCLLFSVYLYI